MYGTMGFLDCELYYDEYDSNEEFIECFERIAVALCENTELDYVSLYTPDMENGTVTYHAIVTGTHKLYEQDDLAQNIQSIRENIGKPLPMDITQTEIDVWDIGSQLRL